MNWKCYSLIITITLLVACAPRPNEWRRVVDIQSSPRGFSAGKLGIPAFRCNNPEIGSMVADSVASNLLDSDLIIVERAYLAQILTEQGLSLSGATEAADYRKIGRLVNIDFLLVGTVNLLEGVAYRGFGKFSSAGTYSFVNGASARIVDIKTGQVLVSCVYRVPSGAGSDYWTNPAAVGKAIAEALKSSLGEMKQ